MTDVLGAIATILAALFLASCLGLLLWAVAVAFVSGGAANDAAGAFVILLLATFLAMAAAEVFGA